MFFLKVNTLAVNYRGAPFMTSLSDNKPLMYALMSVGLFSVALASNMLPDVSSQFEIIIFPEEFRLLALIIRFALKLQHSELKSTKNLQIS